MKLSEELKKSRLKVYALGGLDENGKNLYCIEMDNDIFVIECGLKYPDRTSPGVDIVIPNFSYLEENKDRIKAVIISHGHDDQYGSLPFLLKIVNVPVYATPTTISLIKIDYEKKFKGVKFNFIPVEPSSNKIICGHKFCFFSTTHSVSDSFGFAVETPYGNIVYTGDFISDFGSMEKFTFDLPKAAKLAETKDTLLLLSESSGADKPGIASPNHKITPLIHQYIEDPEGRTFIALYTQNFYNNFEVIDLAVKNGKKICLTNQTLINALPLLNQNGNFIIPKANYLPIEEIGRVAPTDVVILVTGQGEEIFDFMKAIGNGATKIHALTLSEKDTFIVACPSVPATETLATEAIDAIYRTGAKVINLNRKKISSMHAQEEDLKMILSLFKPKYYMPVKGEYRQLMANAKIALSLNHGYSHLNTFIADNGMILYFDDNGKAHLTPMPVLKSGDLLVDGIGVGDVKEVVLQERQKMSDDGVIVLAVTISSKLRKVISSPDVQMRGFIFLKDSENIVKEVFNIFTKVLQELCTKKSLSCEDAEKLLIDRLTKYLRKESGKDPLIVPRIIDIDRYY